MNSINISLMISSTIEVNQNNFLLTDIKEMHVNPNPYFPLNQYPREINLLYQRFGPTSGPKRPNVSSSLSSGCKKDQRCQLTIKTMNICRRLFLFMGIDLALTFGKYN